MTWKFIPGTGLTNVPDPIDKSYAQTERVTEAERASQLPDDKQNQRYSDDGIKKYLVADIEAELQDTIVLVKHELLKDHEHVELKEDDVEMAEQLDENGNATTDELDDDVEYKEELDENGNPIADALEEPDFSMGIEDKSTALKVGDDAVVPTADVAGKVEAIDNDTITIRHDGRLKSFALGEVMPAVSETT